MKVFRSGLQSYAAAAIFFVLFILLTFDAQANSASEITCSKSEAYCKGTKKYISGAVYTGEFKYGKEDGEGQLIWKDGSSYQGEFKNGLREGYGVMVYADKSIYKGDWEKGLMQGYGVYEFACGHVYEGTFAKNEMNGQGRITYATGDVYEGMMFNNKAEGKGSIIKRDGSIFTGMFRHGERLGEGMTVWANGLQLSGNWDYNYLTKEAVFQFPSGLQVTTKWASGKLKKTVTLTTAKGATYSGLLTELKDLMESTGMKGAASASASIYYAIAQEYATQTKYQKSFDWFALAIHVADSQLSEEITKEFDFVKGLSNMVNCW